MNELTREVESVHPGFSSFIAGNGEIEQYADGQVMALRRMQHNDTTESRSKRIKMRRRTNVEVNGTIYGRKHNIRTATVAHSPSGLNVQYTTPAGHPDPEALQRSINRIGPQFTTKDTYENYVALFFSFFRLAWTIEHVDKNEQHRRNVQFGQEVIDLPQPGQDPVNYWNRVRAILSGNAGYACEDGAQTLGELGNQRTANFQQDAQGNRNIRVFWEVPSYDDGYTVINSQRFKTAGFVNQKFLVNNYVRTALVDQNN